MIALDTETTGLDLYHGARPFLVTVCQDDGSNVWWEWDVDPITRQVRADRGDLREIQRTINDADRIVLQNGKFDHQALRLLYEDCGLELRWDWDKVDDTLMAGHLLASNHAHDLTSMVSEYLGKNLQPFEDRMKAAVTEARKIAKQQYPDWRLAKAGLPEMPSARGGTEVKSRGVEDPGPWKYDAWLPRRLADVLGYPADHPWRTVTAEYANSDSAGTLFLFRRQIELIRERGLERIYRERLRLIPIVSDMERRGITLDLGRLEETERRFTEESDRHRRVCMNCAGGQIEKLPVNGVSNDLKRVVFEQLKLPVLKWTDKGNPSMDKFVLDEWIVTLGPKSKAQRFVYNLREYRKRQTGLGYLKSYRKFGIGDGDLLTIHSSLNPTGTDTLRFSSASPNQQQVSKQEESNTRYAFGPAPGREWWCMDYQNLELRIPSYESGERDLIWVFEHPDDPPYYGSYHLVVADLLHPKEFEEHGRGFKSRYASTLYQWVKNGNFAVIYGAQEGTADRTYHVPGAYGKIRRRFPRIAALADRQIEMANRYGYVQTIPDRTVDPEQGYPLLCSRGSWGKVSPTVPLNYHVQSTAMWCTMKAMIRCDEYLRGLNDAYLVMQVHDECVFDFPARGRRNLPKVRRLQRLMEQSGDDIGVPTPVSIFYHPNNWAEGVGP